jgi:L-2-hydroxyglutarate oxidase LhgO
MERVQCIVIGAGVIGLAISRELSRAGMEVIFVDKEISFGKETSSRNSEVIHSGIYYEKDSLMAKLCFEGNRLLYNYCNDHSISFNKCGKLIVSTSEEEDNELNNVKKRGLMNGVNDLSFVSAADISKIEPALVCRSGIYSPSTGVIDSHAYMSSLLRDSEDRGAVFAPSTRIDNITLLNDGFLLSTNDNGFDSIKCYILVNSAGLYATDVAASIKNFPSNFIPKPYYAKGNYFYLKQKCPFQRLIYPLPVKGALGVHLTLDINGLARFGPDIEWVDTIDYTVNEARVDLFYASIRRFWPDLKDESLYPGYVGVRPKIVPPSVGKQDFMIQSSYEHGINNLINLFGIESPGLTSSLAIAKYISNILK